MNEPFIEEFEPEQPYCVHGKPTDNYCVECDKEVNYALRQMGMYVGFPFEVSEIEGCQLGEHFLEDVLYKALT